MASDARLLRACVRGDQDAFASIVRRYQSLICAITYSGTGDLAVSEDLAQETFLQAWQRLASVREPSSLRSWLCAIARNRTSDYLRSCQRDVVGGAVSVEEVEPLEAGAPTPLEHSLSEERAAVVWGALNEMPEDYRMPLILYYREQQSVSRVAEALELSRGAVKSRLMRGRSMLKDKVAVLVEETLTASGPGDTFAVGVMAAVAAVTGKKAVGAGSTILGLSLAKATAVGVLAAGAVVGGGLALHELSAGGPAPAVAAQAPAPLAAEPAVVYAERMPKGAAVMIAMDVRSFNAMVNEVKSLIDDAGIGPGPQEPLQDMLTDLCMTEEASVVDLDSPVRLVSLSSDPKRGLRLVSLFRVTDADRYLASLRAQFRRDGQEGQFQVLTNTERPWGMRTLLVDSVGRWAVLGPDLDDARAVAQMLKAGEFPDGPIFEGAPIGLVLRAAALPLFFHTGDDPFNVLRQGLGIRTGPAAVAPPGSWAALIDAAKGATSRQVQTLAFSAGVSNGVLSLKAQVQPVAGTPLARRLGAKRPGGLGLLKYMPADSLAVLDTQLPDLPGVLPAQDPAPLPVRPLRLLGDEVALALGRFPKGSAQVVLAAKVNDPKGVQNLADELARQVQVLLAGQPQLGWPALPLRLDRRKVVYNRHAIKVWDFSLTRPLALHEGLRALLAFSGNEQRLYEFTVGDTLILAFGDGMFEKVKQIVDGSLEDLGRSPRLTEAMSAMPTQPNAVCYAEAEKLAAWQVECMPGLASLRQLKFQEGRPVVLAGHIIGRDVLEAVVRLPLGAVRAFGEVQKAMLAAAQVAPPPSAAPQALPLPGLHGAAFAGNTGEVERLLLGGADVNLPGPDKRTPLHYAAEAGRLEVVQLLLAKGANVNAEDARRRTPLHLAAQGGHREVAEALLKAGAEVNSTDFDGWTPTGYAVRAGHRDLADLLARSGGVE